jgi:hypothetical protein
MMSNNQYPIPTLQAPALPTADSSPDEVISLVHHWQSYYLHCRLRFNKGDMTVDEMTKAEILFHQVKSQAVSLANPANYPPGDTGQILEAIQNLCKSSFFWLMSHSSY